MSSTLQRLKCDSDGFSGYPNVNFLPPQPPPPQPNLALSKSGAFQMGFEESDRAWVFQSSESRGSTNRTTTSLNGEHVFDDTQDRLSLKLVEESEGNNNSNNNIRTSLGGKSTGHTKLCARGHWRPAEDAKLKELVAQYGPQNWNLIAENLDGRSGIPFFYFLFYKKMPKSQKMKVFFFGL